jgi:1-acyl-sn-glycerol-3-phosphate acyltransferase
LKKIGSIEIIRELTTKKNLNFIDKIKNTIQNHNRPLLIFPQGTRVQFNDRSPFKKGVGRIYDSLKIPCIPVALNSGKIWPKNSFMKYPGNIHISFLEPIKPGLEKTIFLKVLEEKIYSETKKYS